MGGEFAGGGEIGGDSSMMQTKHYCDVCGNECKHGVTKRSLITGKEITIHFTISGISTSRGESIAETLVSDICLDCLDAALLDKKAVIK